MLGHKLQGCGLAPNSRPIDFIVTPRTAQRSLSRFLQSKSRVILPSITAILVTQFDTRGYTHTQVLVENWKCTVQFAVRNPLPIAPRISRRPEVPTGRTAGRYQMPSTSEGESTVISSPLSVILPTPITIRLPPPILVLMPQFSSPHQSPIHRICPQSPYTGPQTNPQCFYTIL